ncbi:PucR family transcriptional regulator [Bacillus weihaiensis]|uniref:PucR C-terminal helix-turn-helix domain-containing protein n=1 Tax=Bacillus weihaiensis TaxID=1547283 RepID=A0A1L3MUT0_9BACI|nr:helix-turn-helix domain-containing protein [Bacillus weihaiensis]APH06088.1 hypothetical protein A9C19_15810 [Bacillus weihaiensis]
MLEKLRQHFKDAFTTATNVNDSTYEWFQTESGDLFGIQKNRLSSSEKTLLASLFKPIESTQQQALSPSQQKWHDYLFSDDNPSSPLASKEKSLRFYYFYLKEAIEDKQSFDEAVTGIVDSELILWLSSSHGVIVEEKPSATFDDQSLKILIDTLTSDFYVEPSFYIGQLQKNDQQLRLKFSLEQQCFQVFHQSSQREKVSNFYEALPLIILHTQGKVNKQLLSNHLIEALEDKELLHTIEAFLQSNLNASSTAKRLYIHRNSLQYRLEKLLENTGLDIRTFSNAAFINLAITINRHL